MKFTDCGIVIGARKYSESALIVKVLSSNNGLCLGYVRSSASSSKNHALYQNFNLIDFECSSKNADSLGFFKSEINRSFLGEIISSRVKLSALSNVAGIIEENILQQDSDNEVFDILWNLLQKLNLNDEDFIKEYIKFEINLLKILGYGVDLSSCAATGISEDLQFVSPKSARAVCFMAGEKYRHKLLPLPSFLLANDNSKTTSINDLLNGLKLSGYFIDKFLNVNLEFKNEAKFSHRNKLIQFLQKKT
jgi:DNA repair protein RecO (recombination protein O)